MDRPAQEPSPPTRANGGHQHGAATLRGFMAIVRTSKAKPHLLPLRRSGQCSDVEAAKWGEPSVSSSSAAPQRGEVVRACGCVCGVPCNLRVARDWAGEQNASVDRAVLIAQEEAAHWEHGMAMQASAVAAFSTTVTAAAAQEASAVRERREAEAAVREAAAAHKARVAQGAIATKEAEMWALEEALAQERARKEAGQRTHADAAKQDAFETARRKVAEEKTRTEVEIRALEAEKARLQQKREEETAAPTRKPRGGPPRTPRRLLRRPLGRSSVRGPKEGPAWTPVEGSSKGTPPRC